MSTRYIKKVFGSNTIPEQNNDADNDTDSPIIVESKSFNLFDMLNPNSNESEEEEQDPSPSHNDSDEGNVKSKKKKRKHKTVKSRSNIKKVDDDIDEIDKTINEVNQLFGELLPNASTKSTESFVTLTKESILNVQHKNLNPYNELKKIFGSKTVQANHVKSRGRSSGHIKKNWLVSPRESWASMGKTGLSMTFDNSKESNGNCRYFSYEFSNTYTQVQQTFLEAVGSMNPENIINIIKIHPYHIDSLLQMAELFKLNEDLAMAAEFIERALYCLECAFHPLFNVTTAQCRLDYRKQQNRALFITLFKHLNFLAGRACYRTSLEFCKLLLSLEPEEDPLAMVLSIDFFALKAKEYDWFCKFFQLWENSKNLTQLPNIAYSLALAHFHLGKETLSNDLLLNALVMFPGVLLPLLDKCGVQPDSKVIQHNFFNTSTGKSTSKALDNLQKLYVIRTYNLWKETNVLSWLEKQVHRVLDRVDQKDDFIRYCELKRQQRYRGHLPRNILRHIILLDMEEIVVNLQEIRNQESILSYDPLPPSDSIDIFRRPVPNGRANQMNSNLFSLFFSTLFRDIDGDNAAAALDNLHLFNDNDENS